MRRWFRLCSLLGLVVLGFLIGFLLEHERHKSWKSNTYLELRLFASGVGNVLVEMARNNACDDIQVMGRGLPRELLTVYATGSHDSGWLSSWFGRVKNAGF